MDRPKRKPLRLPDYDYSALGAYFVTICTHDRRCILSDITVGALHEAPAVSVKLTQLGQIVDEAIQSLPERYSNLTVDQYVVMPNHIHLLLRMEADRALREAPLRQAGTRFLLAKVVGYLKMNCSKRIHETIPERCPPQRQILLIRPRNGHLFSSFFTLHSSLFTIHSSLFTFSKIISPFPRLFSPFPQIFPGGLDIITLGNYSNTQVHISFIFSAGAEPFRAKPHPHHIRKRGIL